MDNADYPPAPPKVPTFPKIAVICGAHTSVGQYLLRDLLQAPEIAKVHALATEEIPIVKRLPSSLLRKARVHLCSFDNLDRAFTRIPEADLGYCCAATDRHAYEKIGMERFKHINLSGPVQFIEKMFELGVLHFSVLSHVNADSDSRSEFNRTKGKVEDYLRRTRKEAGLFSPYISLFKVPTPVSSSSSSSRSADVVDVKSMVKAMQIDSLAKSERKKPPGSKKERVRYEEYFPKDVDYLLREARNSYIDRW